MLGHSTGSYSITSKVTSFCIFSLDLQANHVNNLLVLFQTIYQIKPMENSPQCMIYIPWKTDSMNEDTILFGDDQGMR